MTHVYSVCLVMFLIVLPNITISTKPLLKTKLGLIQGLEADDGDYFMFLGVPYAKVNETNPFGESLPHPPFDTIFEAYDDSIMCPQKYEFNHTLQGTINCLTLNIYVPKSANSTNKLPVLFYVYGGNYITGLNGRYVYGPKYLMRHNIIVVILNYRLGPYGFLCLDIPEVLGNQGFKDQKNALRWVHNNIEDFGGDRNKITMNGQSFGALSIDLILHSLNKNERLFNKVILQSGNYLTPYPILETPHKIIVLKMAEHIGLKTNDVTTAITFLSSINSSLVIEASLKVGIPYSYCSEKTFMNVNTFMPDYRWNMNVSGAKNISFILGNAENESLHLYGLPIPEYYKRLNPIMLSSKHFNMTEKESNEMTKLIHNYYEVNETFSMEIKNKFIQYGNDFYFLHASRLSMLKYMENGAKAIYYYMFLYEGQRNYMAYKLNLTTEEGAMHSDEVSYLFDLHYMKEPSTEDQLIIDRITTLWSNFVKHGNPTPSETKLLPVKWIPYSKEKQNYLDIDTQMSIKSMASNKAISFWDLFFDLNKNKIKHYLD